LVAESQSPPLTPPVRGRTVVAMGENGRSLVIPTVGEESRLGAVG